MPEYVTINKRTYLNADRSKVVEEDDPNAAYLLVRAGGRITLEDAIRYGLAADPGDPKKVAELAASEASSRTITSEEVAESQAADAAEEEPAEEDEEEPEPETVPYGLEVLDENTKNALNSAGIDSAEKVMAAGDDQLLQIDGIGTARLQQIRTYFKYTGK